jgi:hypothetical protein
MDLNAKVVNFKQDFCLQNNYSIDDSIIKYDMLFNHILCNI